MIRLFVIVFSVLGFLPAVQAASYKQDVKKCTDIMNENPAEVEVIYNFGEVKYDFSKAEKEIPVPEYGKDDGGRIQGLTEFEPHFGVETITTASPLSEGRQCFYPKKVTAKIWYNPIVYIAKGLQKGSCRYNLTLRHEQTHLDIGHQIMLMFAQALKVQIPLILERVGPQVSRSGSEVMKQTGDTYNKQIVELNDVFVNALLQKNQEIDKKENYDREDQLCASATNPVMQ